MTRDACDHNYSPLQPRTKLIFKFVRTIDPILRDIIKFYLVSSRTIILLLLNPSSYRKSIARVPRISSKGQVEGLERGEVRKILASLRAAIEAKGVFVAWRSRVNAFLRHTEAAPPDFQFACRIRGNDVENGGIACGMVAWRANSSSSSVLLPGRQ